ncbi:hypothetical protein GKC70_05565 [Pseudomonas sp. REB1044]
MIGRVVGRQAFDGLGRQITVEVGGRRTGFDYQPGRLPTCANQLADGTRIAYTYEANLDERPLTIAPTGGAIHAFAYDPVLGLPSSRSGPLGTLEFRHERSGRPVEDVLTIDGQVHSTQWRYSLNKQLCGLTNALGADHTYHYDASGRLAQHVQGEITTTFTFDTFSRIDTLTTTHGKNTLVRTLNYDSQGREHSRTFSLDTAGKHQKCTQTLGYTDLDQVAIRTWEDGDHNGGKPSVTTIWDALCATPPTSPSLQRIRSATA